MVRLYNMSSKENGEQMNKVQEVLFAMRTLHEHLPLLKRAKRRNARNVPIGISIDAPDG